MSGKNRIKRIEVRKKLRERAEHRGQESRNVEKKQKEGRKQEEICKYGCFRTPKGWAMNLLSLWGVTNMAFPDISS